MTREEAAERVAKLMRLARGNSNPHEASAARVQAKKLVGEHGLTIEELSAGKKADAFDSLVAEIQKLVASRPEAPTGLFDTSRVISDVLQKLASGNRATKAARLDKIAGVIESASVVSGALHTLGLVSSNTIVQKAKKILENVLREHDLERS